jgi:hypothetical protein
MRSNLKLHMAFSLIVNGQLVLVGKALVVLPQIRSCCVAQWVVDREYQVFIRRRECDAILQVSHPPFVRDLSM